MIKQIVYPAVFEKDENGYFVDFPDIVGCHSEGEDLNEAVIMAKEALELCLEVLIEKGETIPIPSKTEDIRGNTMLIVADINNMETLVRPVEKTFSIPYWLYREAEKAHLNFSGVLEEALQEKLTSR
ncbi:MAG: type II toxin-antitoxin system HicB family antitoxin [Oscillospiraceae bacterium]|nr:type II toxin-antitoxin system HicB family antitoxin [Oscillospiraceae bacterium]